MGRCVSGRRLMSLTRWEDMQALADLAELRRKEKQS
jgi:hypothetical protein